MRTIYGCGLWKDLFLKAAQYFLASHILCISGYVNDESSMIKVFFCVCALIKLSLLRCDVIENFTCELCGQLPENCNRQKNKYLNNIIKTKAFKTKWSADFCSGNTNLQSNNEAKWGTAYFVRLFFRCAKLSYLQHQCICSHQRSRV